jgi:aspartate aminotransferase-like enzyme
VSIAPWAASYIEGKKLPRFYFDLQKARKLAPKGETPWTPAVSLIMALEESIKMMNEEGLENLIERHRRLALATHAGAQAAGYRLFSKSPANSLTALHPPDGVGASDVVKRLRDVHGMVVAGGQDHLKGKILRVGHMGSYDLFDIISIVSALEECANHFGHAATGAASAARKAWDQA